MDIPARFSPPLPSCLSSLQHHATPLLGSRVDVQPSFTATALRYLPFYLPFKRLPLLPPPLARLHPRPTPSLQPTPPTTLRRTLSRVTCPASSHSVILFLLSPPHLPTARLRPFHTPHGRGSDPSPPPQVRRSRPRRRRRGSFRGKKQAQRTKQALPLPLPPCDQQDSKAKHLPRARVRALAS